MNVFTHGGSAGDLTYALACVKDMGGGEFYINSKAHHHFRMRPEVQESIVRLIEAQPYITKSGIVDEVVGKDLDEWRKHWKHGLNLSDMVAAWLGVPFTSRVDPWLFAEPKKVARVVFHRSPRYHVEAFPWRKVVEAYGREAVFVGEVEEHAEFCWNFGPVSYWRTDTFLDLARVIAGAEVFVGNQSSPAAVAQGLRKNMILETVPRHSWAWNTHFEREGMVYGYGEDAEISPLDLWPARGRTLLTQDRLEVIARTAREVAGLDGDVVELGVFRGGVTKLLCSLLPAKTVHAFDTFAGLPEDDQGGGVHKAGEFACGLEEVKTFLAGCRVEYHAGRFPETATALLGKTFALAVIDLDIYQATRDAIAWVWPRVVAGGFVVFDDYKWRHCPGVERAITEAGLAGLVEETAPQQCRIKKPS